MEASIPASDAASASQYILSVGCYLASWVGFACGLLEALQGSSCCTHATSMAAAVLCAAIKARCQSQCTCCVECHKDTLLIAHTGDKHTP